MSTATEFKLTLTAGKAEKKSIPVGDERVLIGSGAECAMRLQGEGVGSEHAMIQKTGDAYIVTKRGARPIRVNGKETMQAVLEPGAEIKVGNCKLRFDTGSSRATASDSPTDTAKSAASGGGGMSNTKFALLIIYLLAMIGASAFFLLDTGSDPAPTQGERLLALDAAYDQSELANRDEVLELVREAIYMETRESKAVVRGHLRTALSVTLPAWGAVDGEVSAFEDPLQKYIRREIARHRD